MSECIARLGGARLEPVDLLVGPAHDLLNDSTFSNLQRLCSSGLVGVAAAAPPCSAFSRARLRPGGPPPVRTLNHPKGIPDPTLSQAKELQTSSLLHSRTRFLLHLVACRGGLIWLENPSSSLLWLDPDVTAWCRLTAPHGATVAASPASRPAGTPAKSVLHCTSPGPSSAMTLGLLLLHLYVRIRLVFTPLCPAREHQMAPFLHETRPRTRTLWPSHWRNWLHPGSRRLPPRLRPCHWWTGRLCFLHVCLGLISNIGLKMALVRAARLARPRHLPVTPSAIFARHGPVVC